MFLDGFKYWKGRTQADKTYYRCCRFRHGCPARLAIYTGSSDSAPTPEPGHNHAPESERGLVEAFRRVLTRRAAAEKLSLHKIYIDESVRNAEAALLYPFSVAESAMTKARSKAVHSVILGRVDNLRDAAQVLQNSSNFSIVHCGVRDHFYQTIFSRNNQQTTALAFCHLPTVTRMTKDGLNDAQISVTQVSPDNIHLLTLHHLDKSARITPLVYVVLDQRCPEIFCDIFAYFREKLHLVPAMILCDSLDQAQIHDSLQLTYPEATIKAHWFEYVASVAQQLWHVSSETFRDATNKTILRMILVLPFLPADYMAPGLAAIRKWMRDKGVDTSGTGVLGSVCRFVESAWLRGIGAGKVSMFRVTISAEDHVKQFNKEVHGYVEASRQTAPIWRVIDGLAIIASKVNGQCFERPRKRGKQAPGKEPVHTKSQLLSEAIIKNATEQWITQPIHLRSPLQFLQMASHFITPPFLASVLRRHFEVEEVAAAEKEEVFIHESTEIREEPVTKEIVTVPSVNPPPPTLPQNMFTPCAGNSLRKDPPPLAFIPQVLDKARKDAELLEKRRRRAQMKEPPPLVPILNGRLQSIQSTAKYETQ